MIQPTLRKEVIKRTCRVGGIGMGKHLQVQDRHEHGGLPDTERLFNISKMKTKPMLHKEDPFCEADLPQTAGLAGFPYPLPGLLGGDTVKAKRVFPPGPRPVMAFEDSSSGAKAEIVVDDVGHVTVTCHCARCEAEREGSQPAKTFPEIMEQVRAERAKSGYVVPLGSPIRRGREGGQ